jgi:hypothetical protein
MTVVPTATGQTFAYSGVLYPKPGDPGRFALIEYALSLAGRAEGLRVCYGLRH